MATLRRARATRAPPAGTCPLLPPRPVTSSAAQPSQSVRDARRSVCARAAQDASTSPRPTSAAPAPKAPAPAAASPAALLAAVRAYGTAPGTLNVYGKPFSRSELSALEVVLAHLGSSPRGKEAAAGGLDTLRPYLMELLLDAAARKVAPLPLVEGAMVVLELLAVGEASAQASGGPNPPRPAPVPAASPPPPTAAVARMSPEQMLARWQLVVGADVGAVQYIPAVEELQVPADESSFSLGTDLDFIYTGFSGPCKWLSPGHLSYTVRKVRLELRRPKAWRRAAAWLAWRRRLAAVAAGSEAGPAPAEPDWGDSLPSSPTCVPDPAAPAALLPLSFFPSNEILAFSCDGKVAATRSRLGGLILLLEVGLREQLRAAAGGGGGK